MTPRLCSRSALLALSLALVTQLTGCSDPPCRYRGPDGVCRDDAASGDSGMRVDAGELDSGHDSGGLDSGGLDSGGLDSGSRDSGTLDASTEDAGPPDGGGDASHADADTGPDASSVDASVVMDGGLDCRGTLSVPATLESGGWRIGAVGDPTPPRAELYPLPGAGAGPVVVTSNNPELLWGVGLLYGTGVATRGQAQLPLEGDIGVYLHHVVGRDPATMIGTPKYITLLVENASASPVTVSARGSGYTQEETGGLAIGASPDYRVSEDWITDNPNTELAPVVLMPGEAVVVFQRRAGIVREVDGRFLVQASGPVYVSVVSSETPDLPAVRAATLTNAAGDTRTSGTPPPPFGREAGTYAHSEWVGRIALTVPASERHAAFMVNTATGGGLPQIQAFPAIAHYAESAREAVGMYGNVYDLTFELAHDGTDCEPRRVRIVFAGLSSATPSRYWDGVGLVDGVAQHVLSTPTARLDTLATYVLMPGETRTVQFRAMVPGLTSIPQAIYVESVE